MPQGLRKYIPQRIHVYTSQTRTSERQRAQPVFLTNCKGGALTSRLGPNQVKLAGRNGKSFTELARRDGSHCNFRQFGDHHVVIAPLH
jgi:hypothetical protein